MSSFASKKDVIITSGRFQPLHKGHMKFWEKIKKRFPHNLLLVCVLRNPYELHHFDVKNSNKFLKMSIWTHAKERNPLPNWERFRLISIAIMNNSLLQNSTHVIFRDKPELNWEKSIMDLPNNRVWVFNPQKSSFDMAKIEYYKMKNEKVMEISLDINGFSARKIREELKGEIKDLSFLPEYCHEYFISNCLKYFQSN